MTEPLEVSDIPDPELAAFLGERLYDFNVAATGFDDGRSLSIVVADGGVTVAGLVGHTWGGGCWVSRVWVDAAARGRGLGARMMSAAENEARRRGCAQILLATHSFQAGGFYARLGFARVGAVPDYPRGHGWWIYVKRLDASTA
jgi:GNAT superfamily N-acetyltransferase